MHGHPIQGIKGAKAPKPEKSKPRLSSRPGERIAELSEQYLETRNRQMAAKAFMAKTEAAKQCGELISRKLVGMQAAYLLTICRQRMLLAPAAIARRLGNLALVDPAKEHAISEAIREDIHKLLTEVSSLPAQVTDPNWFEKIDPDFRAQVDGAGPEPRAPVEVKAEAEKAKARREKKLESQRQRRAEGRA